MTGQDAFAIWAPRDAFWSTWAKPVAFLPAEEIDQRADAAANVPLQLSFDPAVAIIVDLPGPEAVGAGLTLAGRGFRPVPLFNGTSGPAPAVDVLPITRSLVAGADTLRGHPILPDAPPAFLLDANRMIGSAAIGPGVYDNRWVTLPQDFPSGALLMSRGIRALVLVERGTFEIADDLAHVLRRWQDQGLTLRVIDISTGRIADGVTVPRPSGFKRVWYTAVALLGLRRSNVGGFGSTIPEQTGRSGFYG